EREAVWERSGTPQPDAAWVCPRRVTGVGHEWLSVLLSPSGDVDAEVPRALDRSSGVIARFVEECWPLTAVEPVGKLHGYSGAGVVRLACDQGQFVLKSANLWDSADTAAEHMAIFDFLAGEGFPHAPRLVKTKAGDAFVGREDHFLYVMEFVSGRPLVPEPASYRGLGGVAAALHNLRGYTHPQQCGIDWLYLMAREAAELLASRTAVDRVLAGLPDFSGLPEAVVHGELGQAIEDRSGRLVLVDWDEAGLGPALIDAAGRLVCDFIDYDLRIDEASATAFYQAYFACRSPSQSELDKMVPLAALYALAYSRFADTEQRVARVLFAIRQTDTLNDIVRSCVGSARPSL
ncbi:MAG: phosphotransferase enzyme family protein, partial [Anaerolineae bacterium]